jgi:glutathione peroxidase
MTSRQKFLKYLYPFFMRFTKDSKRGQIIKNTEAEPTKSIYELEYINNTGEEVSLKEYIGKKILIVNTASNCGYTGQYSELQKLNEEYPSLVIIGFPSNDFKEQEKAADQEIAQFCQINFGVTFPLAKKSSVLKGESQHPLYQWLTTPELNGWNKHWPDWNFSKYLIDEQGRLTHYFGPSVSPLSDSVKNLINK